VASGCVAAFGVSLAAVFEEPRRKGIAPTTTASTMHTAAPAIINFLRPPPSAPAFSTIIESGADSFVWPSDLCAAAPRRST
jgi:hypothetical protein